MTYRIGSLFSGYGGLDQGVEAVIDAETVWVSDIDPGANKILAHRRPTVPNLGDITAIQWADVPAIDVLTGGFPCQDLSTAGKRAGLRDGTRSGLWGVMAQAINNLQPRLVVIENVRGLLSADAYSEMEPCPRCVGNPDGEPVLRALGRVLGDLADLGYDAAWHGLRAADIGAPHGRFRIFIVAYPSATNPGGFGRNEAVKHDGGQPDESDRDVVRSGPDGESGVTLLPTPTASDTNGAGSHGAGGLDLRTTVALLPPPRTANNENRQSETHAGARGNFHGLLTGQVSWGEYAAAISRWENIHGTVPEPTEPGTKRPRLNPAFVEWMMGLPAGWVTDVPGLTRNQQLKLLGNGVVPQQAAAALRHLLPVIP